MPKYSLSPAAIEVLQRYPWPGNVRELENVLERAVMFSSGDEIDPDTLGELIAVGGAGVAATADPPAAEPAAEARPESQLARAARAGVVSTTPLPGVFRVEPQVVRADGVPPPAGPSAAGDAWPTLADVERLHLERTLAATMNNKSQAAKLLGIDRSVLRRKLQRHGLDEPAAPEQ
jgi:two-component system response regulator PilR (NtrC family)